MSIITRKRKLSTDATKMLKGCAKEKRRIAQLDSGRRCRQKVLSSEEKMSGEILGTYAREHFRYDPQTGQLHHASTGRAVGYHCKQHGYINVKIRCRMYRAHQIIWAMHGNSVPLGHCIDHINCVRTDNRIENLRLANSRQSTAHRGTMANNTSGFKGVRPIGSKGKWTAITSVAGRRIYLGRFAIKEDAARAYDAAVIALYGEFAVTNASLGLLPEAGAGKC